jgi:hypothetical protein
VRSARTTALAVGVAAVAVRLPGVWTQSFWQDEVASARILREPTFAGMLRHVGRTESTPPLWYALGWALHRAGVPLVDVRLLSVAAGGALAALTVVLAHRFLPLPLAALSGAFVALGWQFVAHGQELRAYELLALLAVAFAVALLAELDHPSRRHELLLALTVAAGGLTHYFFAFAVIAAGAWLVGERTLGRARWRALVAIGAGGVVPLLWAPVMVTQYRADRFWWIGPFAWRRVATTPFRLFSRTYGHTTIGLTLSFITIAVALAGMVHLARTSRSGRLVAVLAFGPLCLAAALWAGGVHVFALRNLIEIGPFFAIGIAAACRLLPRRVSVATAATAAAALAISLVVGNVSGIPPYDVMARALAREGWSPSDAVVVYGNPFSYRAPLEWYLPHQPTLDISRPLPVHCGVVYVIRPRTFRVERLRVRRPLSAIPRFHGATLLTDAHRRVRCAQPLRSRRFAPLT